jgi:predicted nucleic acid-binding protein
MRAPQLVLDTNVCLDLFVFRDPVLEPLRLALQRADAVAWCDAACRAEWLRVLTYPALALDPARRLALQRDYDERLTSWPAALPPASSGVSLPRAGSDPLRPCATTEPPLPRCTDPDDQKFLELAWAVRADVLLTRDTALLRLARRCRQQHGFDVLPPRDWRLQHDSAMPRIATHASEEQPSKLGSTKTPRRR